MYFVILLHMTSMLKLLRGGVGGNEGVETAGPKDVGPMMSENEGPNRSSGKCGTKMQDQKCGSGKCRTNIS